MQRQDLVPPACFVVSVITMVCLAILVPGPRIAPFPWNLLGLLPFAAGAALAVVAGRVVKNNTAGGESSVRADSLLAPGLFRMGRNPSSLGHLLMLVGLAVCLGTLTPLLVIPIFVFLLQMLCAGAEGRTLEERFVDTWTRYRSTVRRWL